MHDAKKRSLSQGMYAMLSVIYYLLVHIVGIRRFRQLHVCRFEEIHHFFHLVLLCARSGSSSLFVRLPTWLVLLLYSYRSTLASYDTWSYVSCHLLGIFGRAMDLEYERE